MKQNKATQLGVSNYGPQGLERVYKMFDTKSEGTVKIVTNQIQSSLLAQGMLESGVVDMCKDLGMTPLAYSPLALGLLTDKYNEVVTLTNTISTSI